MRIVAAAMGFILLGVVSLWLWTGATDQDPGPQVSPTASPSMSPSVASPIPVASASSDTSPPARPVVDDDDDDDDDD